MEAASDKVMSRQPFAKMVRPMLQVSFLQRAFLALLRSALA